MDKEAERIDPKDWERYPYYEPMVPGSARREKPSTDQRKIRRRMRRSRETQNRTKKHSHIVEFDAEEHMNNGEEAVLRSWASKERVESMLFTADRPNLLSIRAQQVLDFLEEKS